MTAPIRDWWEDHHNLAQLYRWLDATDETPEVVEFLEKPWKWTPEWVAFNGRDLQESLEASLTEQAKKVLR